MIQSLTVYFNISFIFCREITARKQEGDLSVLQTDLLIGNGIYKADSCIYRIKLDISFSFESVMRKPSFPIDIMRINCLTILLCFKSHILPSGKWSITFPQLWVTIFKNLSVFGIVQKVSVVSILLFSFFYAAEQRFIHNNH